MDTKASWNMERFKFKWSARKVATQQLPLVSPNLGKRGHTQALPSKRGSTTLGTLENLTNVGNETQCLEQNSTQARTLCAVQSWLLSASESNIYCATMCRHNWPHGTLVRPQVAVVFS